MERASHTPGPVQKLSGSDYYVDVAVGEERRAMTAYGRTPAIAEERARLIAAAPDLREAVEQAIERLELAVKLRGGFYGDDFRAVESCRAALAKATGPA